MCESDKSTKKRDAAVTDAVPTEDELEDFRTLLERTRLIIVQQTLAHDSGVLALVNRCTAVASTVRTRKVKREIADAYVEDLPLHEQSGSVS